MKTLSFILFGLLLMFGACKMSVEERNKKMLAAYAKSNDELCAQLGIICSDYKLVSVEPVPWSRVAEGAIKSAGKLMDIYVQGARQDSLWLESSREDLSWDVKHAADMQAAKDGIEEKKQDIKREEGDLAYDRSRINYYKKMIDSVENSPAPVVKVFMLTCSLTEEDPKATPKIHQRKGICFLDEDCKVIEFIHYPEPARRR